MTQIMSRAQIAAKASRAAKSGEFSGTNPYPPDTDAHAIWRAEFLLHITKSA